MHKAQLRTTGYSARRVCLWLGSDLGDLSPEKGASAQAPKVRIWSALIP